MKSNAEGEREKRKKNPQGGRRNGKVPRHQTSRPIQSENLQKSRKPQKKKKVLFIRKFFIFLLPLPIKNQKVANVLEKEKNQKSSNDFQFLTGC
jgi:hypothetical protein